MFIYSITGRGTAYHSSLDNRAPNLSGEEWDVVAPRAAILDVLEIHGDSSIQVFSKEEPAAGHHPEILGKALHFLVRKGYVDRKEGEDWLDEDLL